MPFTFSHPPAVLSLFRLRLALVADAEIGQISLPEGIAASVVPLYNALDSEIGAPWRNRPSRERYGLTGSCPAGNLPLWSLEAPCPNRHIP